MTTPEAVVPPGGRFRVWFAAAIAASLAVGFAGGWLLRESRRDVAEPAPHLWVHSVYFRDAVDGKQRIFVGYNADGVTRGVLAMEVFAYPGGEGPISTLRRPVPQGDRSESIEIDFPPWRPGPAYARLVVLDGDRRLHSSSPMKFDVSPKTGGT